MSVPFTKGKELGYEIRMIDPNRLEKLVSAKPLGQYETFK